MCVLYFVCVSYLGSYQTNVLHHVRLHHLRQQLAVARCPDEFRAAVGRTPLLGSRWDLQGKITISFIIIIILQLRWKKKYSIKPTTMIQTDQYQTIHDVCLHVFVKRGQSRYLF